MDKKKLLRDLNGAFKATIFLGLIGPFLELFTKGEVSIGVVLGCISIAVASSIAVYFISKYNNNLISDE